MTQETHDLIAVKERNMELYFIIDEDGRAIISENPRYPGEPYLFKEKEEAEKYIAMGNGYLEGRKAFVKEIQPT